MDDCKICGHPYLLFLKLTKTLDFIHHNTNISTSLHVKACLPNLRIPNKGWKPPQGHCTSVQYIVLNPV